MKCGVTFSKLKMTSSSQTCGEERGNVGVVMIRSAAYTAKVFVQQLDISVNDLESNEFVVISIDSTAEVQTSISEQERKEEKQS